jgi:DNA-binding NarL/FixJ family response regulator
MSIRIVVADDHPVTRTGMITILQRDDTLEVVGEAEDGPQVLAICRAQKPDLLLLDLRLPKVSGLAVARGLRMMMAHPPRILVFSAYADNASVRAALHVGAVGYVLKSEAGEDLLAAIHRVMQGEQVLLGVDGAADSGHARLSPQELVVLRHVAEGLTSKEIAQQVGTSARTVETYLERIYHKLGARNRTEAVMVAQREELLASD